MLLPYNTLKQSEYNLPFRHINKSMKIRDLKNKKKKKQKKTKKTENY